MFIRFLIQPAPYVKTSIFTKPRCCFATGLLPAGRSFSEPEHCKCPETCAPTFSCCITIMPPTQKNKCIAVLPLLITSLTATIKIGAMPPEKINRVRNMRQRRMKTKIRAIVIANPVSGHGKARRHLQAVLDRLRRPGWVVDAFETEKPGQAEKAAAAFDGDILISFGGDGTFNEILNGADTGRHSFAVIPAGTGNVLAKELRMPLHPLKAADAVVNGKILEYDVGIANGRRFAFACGAGLDAHIVRLLHGERTGNITQFHYLPYLLKNLLAAPDWEIRTDVDGKLLSSRANMVCTGNTRSYGGPVELTPCADPSDGQIDVTCMRAHSLLDLPALSLAALTRGLACCSHALCARGKTVRLTASRGEIPYHIDGDFAGTLPLAISFAKQKMRIIGAAAGYAREALLPL